MSQFPNLQNRDNSSYLMEILGGLNEKSINILTKDVYCYFKKKKQKLIHKENVWYCRRGLGKEL